MTKSTLNNFSNNNLLSFFTKLLSENQLALVKDSEKIEQEIKNSNYPNIFLAKMVLDLAGSKTEAQKIKLIKEILEYDPNNSFDNSVLVHNCHIGATENVAEILNGISTLEKEEDRTLFTKIIINQPDKNGFTPLISACSSGSVAIVEKIFDTIIKHIPFNDLSKFTKECLQANDINGSTALIHSFKIDQKFNSSLVIFAAIESVDKENKENILESCLDQKNNYGFTPLMSASFKSTDSAQLIIGQIKKYYDEEVFNTKDVERILEKNLKAENKAGFSVLSSAYMQSKEQGNSLLSLLQNTFPDFVKTSVWAEIVRSLSNNQKLKDKAEQYKNLAKSLEELKKNLNLTFNLNEEKPDLQSTISISDENQEPKILPSLISDATPSDNQKPKLDYLKAAKTILPIIANNRNLALNNLGTVVKSSNNKLTINENPIPKTLVPKTENLKQDPQAKAIKPSIYTLKTHGNKNKLESKQLHKKALQSTIANEEWEVYDEKNYNTLLEPVVEKPAIILNGASVVNSQRVIKENKVESDISVEKKEIKKFIREDLYKDLDDVINKIEFDKIFNTKHSQLNLQNAPTLEGNTSTIKTHLRKVLKAFESDKDFLAKNLLHFVFDKYPYGDKEIKDQKQKEKRETKKYFLLKVLLPVIFEKNGIIIDQNGELIGNKINKEKKSGLTTLSKIFEDSNNLPDYFIGEVNEKRGLDETLGYAKLKGKEKIGKLLKESELMLAIAPTTSNPSDFSVADPKKNKKKRIKEYQQNNGLRGEIQTQNLALLDDKQILILAENIRNQQDGLASANMAGRFAFIKENLTNNWQDNIELAKNSLTFNEDGTVTIFYIAFIQNYPQTIKEMFRQIVEIFPPEHQLVVIEKILNQEYKVDNRLNIPKSKSNTREYRVIDEDDLDTAINMACRNNSHHAIKETFEQINNILNKYESYTPEDKLKFFTNILTDKNEIGHNCLMTSCIQQSHQSSKEILSAIKDAPLDKDGKISIVKQLINQTDNNGNNLLMMACANNNYELVIDVLSTIHKIIPTKQERMDLLKESLNARNLQGQEDFLMIAMYNNSPEVIDAIFLKINQFIPEPKEKISFIKDLLNRTSDNGQDFLMSAMLGNSSASINTLFLIINEFIPDQKERSELLKEIFIKEDSQGYNFVILASISRSEDAFGSIFTKIQESIPNKEDLESIIREILTNKSIQELVPEKEDLEYIVRVLTNENNDDVTTQNVLSAGNSTLFGNATHLIADLRDKAFKIDEATNKMALISINPSTTAANANATQINNNRSYQV